MSADSTITAAGGEQVRPPRRTVRAFGATLSAVALAGAALVATGFSGAPAQAAQTGVT